MEKKNTRAQSESVSETLGNNSTSDCRSNPNMNHYELRITFGESAFNHYSIRDTKEKGAKAFGGFSVIDHSGGWVNDDGELIEEDSKTLVFQCSDDDFQGAGEKRDGSGRPITPRSWVSIQARMIQSLTDEDAVMWSVRSLDSAGME